MKTAAVIGSGPAGLMAAEALAQAGCRVTVYEHKPSVARKFLMAGKSGLNLTADMPLEPLLQAYHEAADAMRPMLSAFDATAVQDWARDLGQPIFTGSTGRVFPEAMKASPLLRAWLARLDALGVVRKTGWRWQGWDEGAFLAFDQGLERADVCVLALGGGSWARLGSDGAWQQVLRQEGVPVYDFGAANVGFCVPLSPHMRKHIGAPVKAVAWCAGSATSRGEGVISETGLEGGGLYPLARWVREGAALSVDLLPDLSTDEVASKLRRPRGKASLANHLRKVLKLDAVKIALAQEWGRPLPKDAGDLAITLKNLRPGPLVLRPLDQAISTSGGVPFSAVDAGLMLRARPGVFVAGEMLDWEAPTGGYLLQACFATGRWAGQHAASFTG